MGGYRPFQRAGCNRLTANYRGSMIKTELCDMLGVKYPFIQAGMGPFGTGNLTVSTSP